MFKALSGDRIMNWTKLTGVVLLLILSLFLWSCMPKHHGFKRIEHVFEVLSDKLDLDDKQKQVLEEIKQQVLEKKKAFMQHKQSHKDSLIELVRKDSLTKMDLKSFFDEHKKHQEEMHDFVMDKFIEFHAILNPEQKELLVEKIEKFHKFKFGKHD